MSGGRPRNFKICPVCGASFPAAPSAKKITCSSACSKIRHAQTHGKSTPWGEEAKARKRAAVAQDPEALAAFIAKGHAARAAAPERFGKTATNVTAKCWTLKAPDNRIFEVRNLIHFCRGHPEFFDNPKNAANGLSSTGHWKGWGVLWSGEEGKK